MAGRELFIGAAMLYVSAIEPAHASANLPNPLNLLCSGQAEKTEYTIDETVRSQSADVRLYLAGDGGSAEIPRFIRGAKDGHQVVKLFSVSDTAITGKINYNPIGNAKMRIDRVTGNISITGPGGNFSGQCHPFDPGQIAPKF